MWITNSFPNNHINNPPNDRKGAKGITCPNLTKFKGKPTKQNIPANIYDIPTPNNVPKGPSQRASIATNFESPFPIAFFLKIYLVKYLKVSRIKNDRTDEPIPFASKRKSIILLLNRPININPKRPVKKPKFIKLWGIQKVSISIKAMQINMDRNNQLNNILNNKLEEELYREGELFMKMTKRIAVINSTKGYLIEIDVLQCLHWPFWINQLIRGIFSLQVNLVLHFGQKLLGFIIDKSLGKR